MPAAHDLWLFAAASIALLVAPGPAVGYVIAQSAEHGARFGIAASAGNVTGGILHVVAAIAGLGTLIVRFPAAYDALRFAGAAYLIWLGIRQLRPHQTSSSAAEPRTVRDAYVGGIAVNATNPKGILFFGAFLPQFLRPAAGHVVSQIAILGALFLMLALINDCTYAIVASRFYPLMGNRESMRWTRYITASVYFALGIAAAVLRRAT